MKNNDSFYNLSYTDKELKFMLNNRLIKVVKYWNNEIKKAFSNDIKLEVFESTTLFFIIKVQEYDMRKMKEFRDKFVEYNYCYFNNEAHLINIEFNFEK